MKTFLKKKPRQFEVGNKEKFKIKDFGKIKLNENEQITFINEDGGEYDLAKKNWGFYATPSINSRLKNFGFRTLLIKNKKTKRFFIFLLENGKEKILNDYIRNEGLKIVCYLDDESTLTRIESKT